MKYNMPLDLTIPEEENQEFEKLEPCSEKFKPDKAAQLKSVCEACGIKFKLKMTRTGQLEVWIPKGQDLTDFWEKMGF
jgi:hypothetical protein